MAVITGGGRGIGRGIAERLARDGAHCAITYRKNADVAAEAVAVIEREGVKALALPLELAEPSQVGPAFERIAEVFGRVDVLVASAAATAFRPLLEQKAHNVRLTFAISVESLIALVQAAVPLMRGRLGRIVAISGIDSFQAMAGHGVLGGAKAAMESLVRAFALELGPRGSLSTASIPASSRRTPRASTSSAASAATTTAPSRVWRRQRRCGASAPWRTWPIASRGSPPTARAS